MKLNKTSSFSFKTLISLIIFSITILLFLMFSQNIILKFSYERYQLRNLNKITKTLQSYSSEDLIKNLELISYENGVCAQYITNNSTIYYNTLMVGCGLNKGNNQISDLINGVIASNSEIKNFKLVDSSRNVKAILSGVKVENGYVFIYSLLENINSSNQILKSQVVIITIAIIILACIIAYFLSIKITKPITNITKQAKYLGEGKYDIEFAQSGILEIDELANTLRQVGSDLSKIDELRRDLMANVSHDLKTPLTMIRAYAEMVRDITYKDEEKRTQDLNVIIEETERLNILVNDILELSKMQADADTLKIEKFDLVKVIKEVMGRYEILKTLDDYKFILELPEKAMVKADVKKITQVIYNLVNNAINYTGKDKKVYVKLKKEKKEFILEVRDTGKGIDKEEIPYIWNKYYKNDKKHQRNVVSTGLGLAIVREILVKHKFDYGVRSQKNKGTTFYFKIKEK